MALSAPFSATGVCPGNGPLSPLNCFAVANYFPLSGLHWQFQHVLGFRSQASWNATQNWGYQLVERSIVDHHSRFTQFDSYQTTSHPHYSSWHGTLPIRLKTGEDHSTVCDLVMSWRPVFLPKVLQFQILEIWILFLQQFPRTFYHFFQVSKAMPFGDMTLEIVHQNGASVDFAADSSMGVLEVPFGRSLIHSTLPKCTVPLVLQLITLLAGSISLGIYLLLISS